MPGLTGKYVFDANRDIIRLLRERGMLLGEQTFHHSYPYCWRSKTPIIFRNVEQFFIRIDELRGKGKRRPTRLFPTAFILACLSANAQITSRLDHAAISPIPLLPLRFLNALY